MLNVRQSSYLLAVAILTQSFSFSVRAAPARHVESKVSFHFYKIDVRRDYTLQQMHEFAVQKGNSENQWPRGFFYSVFSDKIKVDKKYPGSYLISVDVGINDPTVEIASDLNQNICEKNSLAEFYKKKGEHIFSYYRKLEQDLPEMINRETKDYIKFHPEVTESEILQYIHILLQNKSDQYTADSSRTFYEKYDETKCKSTNVL
ncbi:hypothetical protein HLH26_11840 [Gluconacetobacter sp. 1b LMG 1731]|uniref:Uncharacterized protein n=1 Tax=Gluconacetobacter dulcium TaxID=2729096 RepID=A0A7W4IMA7_9PROT|nr:hypothetical protein [Gluconacetobacter dulcium]MBB2165212.1 hypothetical protein [Gluconacetobacter dulcium]MBB2194379.1 hypothetical protein [Gluconacetobacter dulcium]